MDDERFVKAPWTAIQVNSLNEYQKSGSFHPFTCGNRDHPCHDRKAPIDVGLLTATKDGWVCDECGYTQDWAWVWMADWAWQDMGWG